MRSSVPESRRALKEKPHALRALLLALDTGPRRIRAARAGGSGSRLYRCRASAAARRSDVDALPGRQVAGAPALRAAVPQGGKARDRADGEHPPLARPAPRPGAEKRGVPALGAPAPAHDGRLAGRSTRCASPDRRRLLLRGPEARIEAPRRALHRRAPAEIPRLLRAGAHARKSRMASRQGILVRGPVALPDDRGPALCLPPRDAMAGGVIPASRIAVAVQAPEKLLYRRDVFSGFGRDTRRELVLVTDQGHGAAEIEGDALIEALHAVEGRLPRKPQLIAHHGFHEPLRRVVLVE